MPNLLIQNLFKKPDPHPPFEMEGNTFVVSGLDSVPVELHFEGAHSEGAVGVDIVFLVDQSGSMDINDPNKKRFSAIKTLINEFAPSRNSLDRVTVVTFKGNTAVLEQDWKTWSETEATVDLLMNSSPGNLTPMEAGMRKANQLLGGMNGFYKIVILLSDGWPEPDDENYPQSQIIRDVLVPEACESRIIYSTIYLHTPEMPDENALLWYIARQTDYITDYSLGDAPRYYFKIENTGAILSAYRELFVSVHSRIVPQYVFLQERVNPKLIIDPDAPVSFSGDGLAASQNVIGDVTLDEAIQRFRSENLFTLTLNELDGGVSLKFSVKINRQALSQADFEADYVTVPVDVLSDSFIRYLQPTGVTGSAVQELPLTQATIKFILGVQVRKRVLGDGQLVEVRFSNLGLHPVEMLEIDERPSGFLEAYEKEDDFDFQPFEIVFDKLVVPWFLTNISQYVLEIPRPPDDRIPGPGPAEALVPALSSILAKSCKHLLANKTKLNPYLSQFFFFEDRSDIQGFWKTVNQRGTYMNTKSIPSKSDKVLRFKVKDASSVPTGGPQWLISPVDAVESKGLIPMSMYKTKGMANWKHVIPNPDHYQLCTDILRPDLFIATCFSSMNISEVSSFMTGRNLPISRAWKIFNSVDIGLIIQAAEDPLSSLTVSVTTRNCGNAPGKSKAHVKSYFIPFVISDWKAAAGELRDISAPNLDNVKPTAPFFATGTIDITLQPGSSPTSRIVYDQYYFIRPRMEGRERVEKRLLKKVKDAIVITTVDIDAAPSEVLFANNNAIEIVTLKQT